jgi:hypothetical protein
VLVGGAAAPVTALAGRDVAAAGMPTKRLGLGGGCRTGGFGVGDVLDLGFTNRNIY